MTAEKVCCCILYYINLHFSRIKIRFYLPLTKVCRFFLQEARFNLAILLLWPNIMLKCITFFSGLWAYWICIWSKHTCFSEKKFPGFCFLWPSCGKNISGIPIKRPNPAAFYKRQNPRPLNKKAQKGKTADEREFLPAAYVPDLQRKLWWKPHKHVSEKAGSRINQSFPKYRKDRCFQDERPSRKWK